MSRGSARERSILPIVVSVLGDPGADMKLLDAIIRTLEHADRKTAVGTGSKMGFTAKYVRKNPSMLAYRL